MYGNCVACAENIKGIIGGFYPETAVVLGSGLGGFADEIEVKYSVDYSSLPDFPVSTVQGHSGKFVFGLCAGKPIAIAQGRVHLYEGYASDEAIMPVRVLKLLGINTVILTNAAGGINGEFRPGDVMLITDHISFFVKSPLVGKNIDEFGVRFPNMTEVYDKKLQDIAFSAAMKRGIPLKTGVYAQIKGPQYETPAEIRALESLGADAVGMSTAIEAIAARHCGMRVCGLSVITNMAAGKSKFSLSHGEVINAAKGVEKDLFELIGSIIKKI